MPVVSRESLIRVGVSLDGRRIRRWQRDALLELRATDGVELALVVLTPAERSPDRGLAGALLRLYRAADRRVFAVEPDPLERVDATELLAGVPVVDRGRGGSGNAPPEPLDVAIALGGERDPLLSGARHGLWTYRHGVGRERRDDVPYLRDIRERRLASQVALVRESDRAILARSTVRTDLVSLQRVRGAALLRCRHLAARCLRDLRDGVDNVAGQDEPEVTRVSSGGPSVASLLAIAGRILLRLLAHRVYHAVWHEQWSLVVRPSEDRSPPLSFADGRQLRPPRGRDWADPFPLRAGDRSWLFFEEVPWRGGHGHINVGELDDRGRLRDVRVALATRHHLSYPFVFTHDGQSYLLPESRTSSATTLYRARSLPDDWVASCVLADVALYDPTLLLRDGVWWLFGTVAAPGESEDDELHLFHASALDGPWHAHPRNPVVSDVRGARPAGPFIRDGDRILRPAQDCSGRYGRAVVFKEVLELSPTAYREVEVARLEPDWLARNLATHHYATDSRWLATDARRRRRRW
jgi:hypothetical protein